MDLFEAYRPAMAMVVAQFIYAGVSLFTRDALLQGMSPRVFVVYRQAIATLVISPIAVFSSWRQINTTTTTTTTTSSLSCRSFSLIFLASLIGVTGTQNAYFEGLSLADTSISIATTNLIPSITFVMAFIIGESEFQKQEKFSESPRNGHMHHGAACMALVKGPKLLNSKSPQQVVFYSGDENLVVGFLYLFGSCCCWSIWLIMQVPISQCYPNHLSSSAWMCCFSTLQCAALTLFLEREHPEAWVLHKNIEFASCVYSGVIGTGLAFFLQTWCISKKGPLFSAMFYPLSTLIGTILASLFLHEEVYTGCLVGTITLIVGLYVVLWGKAEDHCRIQEKKSANLQSDLEQSLLHE